jgi:hypothetical protein
MKNQLKTAFFALTFFVLGVLCESSHLIGISLAHPADRSENGLWFLISVRERLAQNNIADAGELIDIKIDSELTNLRQDKNLIRTVSGDLTWKTYLSKINSIWKNSPPFDSSRFKSQESQDWYVEFVQQHRKNQKFLDDVSLAK